VTFQRDSHIGKALAKSRFFFVPLRALFGTVVGFQVLFFCVIVSPPPTVWALLQMARPIFSGPSPSPRKCKPSPPSSVCPTELHNVRVWPHFSPRSPPRFPVPPRIFFHPSLPNFFPPIGLLTILCLVFFLPHSYLPPSPCLLFYP